MTTHLMDPPSIDIDTVPVALMTLDRKRRIEAMNTKAEAIFGLSRRTGRGKRLSEVLYHDCQLFDLIDRASETFREVSSPALILQGPAIKNQSAWQAAVTLTNEGGYALALSQNGVADLSDIDTAGLAAFGRILGHEVKNPLAGLSGATQLLLRGAREDQKELLDLILSESARIARLVDKMSAFELFSAPETVPCNVHKILEQAVKSEELAFGKSVKFERNFDPSLPDILADGDHLHEAFQNIIRNAAEAVRDYTAGDTVNVSTRFSLDGPNARIGTKQGGRFVKVAITDNGSGISKADQKRIFEMFQTTKPNGSGLGLTVASQVINSHAGHLSVTSQPGRTVFKIYLPIAKVS